MTPAIKFAITVTTLLFTMNACTTVNTPVAPVEPTYADVFDELEARIGDINRTLVKCWTLPTCKHADLVTWTGWRTDQAPHFIIRRPAAAPTS